MKRKNAARSALVTSIISLLLCVSMLVGTTFAWFTDEVKSGMNTIAAGNLDIELLANGTAVTSDTKLFDDVALWEPGVVVYENLQVVNAGNLALQYQMTLNFGNENATQDGHKLSEVLKVAIIDKVAEGATRAQVMQLANAAPATELSEFILSGELEAKATGSAFAVVVFWAPNDNAVDNLYNMNNGKTTTDGNPLHIQFGVKLFATQLTSEEDSFGKDYDEGAEMPKVYDHVVSTAEELAEAIKAGGSIQLAGDIELNGRLDIQPGVEVELDMNGKTLSVDSDVDYAFIVREGASLTIDGNGTVEAATPATVLFYPGGNLTIENGTFVRNVPEGYAGSTSSMFVGTKPASGWESTGVVINGGYFDSGYYDKNADDVEALLAGTKELDETADDIAKRGVAGDKNKVRVALKNNIMTMLNRSNNYIKVYGGTFVGANPAWGDEGGMLPTEPNYLRPWSYYQGALLDGQTFNKDGIVLPAGYTITHSTAADGRPVYTVNYSK